MTHIALTLTFVAGSLLLGGARALAEDTVSLTNDLNQPLYLWFWPRGANDYTRPPMFLPRQGPVTLIAQKECYLVAKDLAGNEDHLSWVDLLDLSRKVPNAKLRVRGGYVRAAASNLR